MDDHRWMCAPGVRRCRRPRPSMWRAYPTGGDAAQRRDPKNPTAPAGDEFGYRTAAPHARVRATTPTEMAKTATQHPNKAPKGRKKTPSPWPLAKSLPTTETTRAASGRSAAQESAQEHLFIGNNSPEAPAALRIRSALDHSHTDERGLNPDNSAGMRPGKCWKVIEQQEVRRSRAHGDERAPRSKTCIPNNYPGRNLPKHKSRPRGGGHNARASCVSQTEIITSAREPFRRQCAQRKLGATRHHDTGKESPEPMKRLKPSSATPFRRCARTH